jgi:DNA primase
VARIRDSSVRDVVAAADIVEVVNGRTQLRRASGSRFTGRCPFHEERTPSFSVNPVEKLYYCFGCGKGGDLISFVRETENLDFVGAIEWLAERFRVQLEYEEASPRVEAERKRRERLLALLEQTTAYFERLLWEGDTGKSVRDYLASRGLGEEVAREFRLGLSPGGGLAEKAKERGFSLDELRGAGLATVRGGDYFPQRLMFPLSDARGRVLGFQARKLHDDDPLRGKYVNSPESDLFKKGSILYGLHLARTAVSKQDRAVVVEGNTDVIALRQAGFEPVIASMGTALTERQLSELKRLTNTLFLCFDTDAAGRDATLRGMGLAATQGFDVNVVSLRSGKDPAEAPNEFIEQLDESEPHLVHLTRATIARNSESQQAFVELQALYATYPDTPQLRDAIAVAASVLQLSKELQVALVPARHPSMRRELADEAIRSREDVRALQASERLERDALAACVAFPSLIRWLSELSPEHFTSERLRRFRAALVSGRDDPELTALKAELDARAASEAIDERTGKELLLRLRERKLKRDLSGADLARTTELQAHLAKVRQALAELT